MSFILPNLLGLLVNPSTILILLCMVGLVLLWSGSRRGARFFLTLGVGGFLVVLLLPVQQWVLLPLEDRFARPLAPTQVEGIIVLGGALESFVTAERGIPSLNGAAERMTELVTLARRYPRAKLVFTGGYASVFAGGVPEAEIARQLLGDLGLDTSRITFEDESRNTYENAVDVTRIVPHTADQTWLLVTSAMHMPRSMGVFRKAGWELIPWPVGYKAVQNPMEAILTPPGDKLAQIDDGAHEWVGMLAYWLAGRSDTLFPAP